MELISNEGPFSAGSVLDGEEMIRSVTELLRYNAHPEYLTAMVSEAVTQEYPGPEGFEAAFREWMSPYESFRFELDEVIPLKNRLVITVRQIVRMPQSSGEVVTPSASVWWFEDGQVRQAAFYLDRQAGLKAAGLSAPDHP